MESIGYSTEQADGAGNGQIHHPAVLSLPVSPPSTHHEAPQHLSTAAEYSDGDVASNHSPPPREAVVVVGGGDEVNLPFLGFKSTDQNSSCSSLSVSSDLSSLNWGSCLPYALPVPVAHNSDAVGGRWGSTGDPPAHHPRHTICPTPRYRPPAPLPEDTLAPTPGVLQKRGIAQLPHQNIVVYDCCGGSMYCSCVDEEAVGGGGIDVALPFEDCNEGAEGAAVEDGSNATGPSELWAASQHQQYHCLFRPLSFSPFSPSAPPPPPHWRGNSCAPATMGTLATAATDSPLVVLEPMLIVDVARCRAHYMQPPPQSAPHYGSHHAFVQESSSQEEEEVGYECRQHNNEDDAMWRRRDLVDLSAFSAEGSCAAFLIGGGGEEDDSRDCSVASTENHYVFLLDENEGGTLVGGGDPRPRNEPDDDDDQHHLHRHALFEGGQWRVRQKQGAMHADWRRGDEQEEEGLAGLNAMDIDDDKQQQRQHRSHIATRVGGGLSNASVAFFLQTVSVPALPLAAPRIRTFIGHHRERDQMRNMPSVSPSPHLTEHCVLFSSDHYASASSPFV